MRGNDASPEESVLERLEDQIQYFDSKSVKYQRTYKVLNYIVIAAAALVPFSIVASWPVWVAAGFGVIIAVAQGAQHVGQFHGDWISSRSTWQALSSERGLYYARASVYADSQDLERLLAERMEGILAGERSRWMAIRGEAQQAP